MFERNPEQAKLPEIYIAQYVGDLVPGDVAFVHDDALWVDEERNGWIDGSIRLEPNYFDPSCEDPLRIIRMFDGFVVDLVTHPPDIKFVGRFREMTKTEVLSDLEFDWNDQKPVVAFLDSDEKLAEMNEAYRATFYKDLPPVGDERLPRVTTKKTGRKKLG